MGYCAGKRQDAFMALLVIHTLTFFYGPVAYGLSTDSDYGSKNLVIVHGLEFLFGTTRLILSCVGLAIMETSSSRTELNLFISILSFAIFSIGIANC